MTCKKHKVAMCPCGTCPHCPRRNLTEVCKTNSHSLSRNKGGRPRASDCADKRPVKRANTRRANRKVVNYAEDVSQDEEDDTDEDLKEVDGEAKSDVCNNIVQDKLLFERIHVAISSALGSFPNKKVRARKSGFSAQSLASKKGKHFAMTHPYGMFRRCSF